MAPELDNSLHRIINGDCLRELRNRNINGVALSFIDPPFRQGKSYRYFDDTQPESVYWEWMRDILKEINLATVYGGSVYFMQREKNTEQVLEILREAGWTYQNLIIWKKKTSAVPCDFRYAKQYQIIVFATKGPKPSVFNKLRVDLPLAPEHKYARANGVFLTDVWDDIRELTSGYFAGDEALRELNGDRAHVQQSPIALLLRIVLSSTSPNDVVLDPFAGSGTTAAVAEQLLRRSISIEIDPRNVEIIKKRLLQYRKADSIQKFRHYYRFTTDLDSVWPLSDKLPVIGQPINV